MRIRPPAVADAFYPADVELLRALVGGCFADAVAPPPRATVPEAIVVPHAGLVYSGPIAASAYRRVAPARDAIRRVVLLGPAHRAYVRGLAASSADAWSTPLGLVPLVDLDTLPRHASIVVDDRAHAAEHSLEVQLPFLQTVLDTFELLPLVVGDATADEVAAVLDSVWGGRETLVVVSTDLSHYHRYRDAVDLDARTSANVAALRADDIADSDACGARPLRGLLEAGRQRHLTVEQIDLRNSGDTAGDRSRVVGYGAFALA